MAHRRSVASSAPFESRFVRRRRSVGPIRHRAHEGADGDDAKHIPADTIGRIAKPRGSAPHPTCTTRFPDQRPEYRARALQFLNAESQLGSQHERAPTRRERTLRITTTITTRNHVFVTGSAFASGSERSQPADGVARVGPIARIAPGSRTVDVDSATHRPRALSTLITVGGNLARQHGARSRRHKQFETEG